MEPDEKGNGHERSVPIGTLYDKAVELGDLKLIASGLKETPGFGSIRIVGALGFATAGNDLANTCDSG